MLNMKHNLYKMMGLDIYLSSLSKNDYKTVSSKIFNDSRIITALMSWDAYSEGYLNTLQEAKRQQDIDKVKLYADKLNWQNDIDSIFEEEIYEAIIITDINQKIMWVNKEFSTMTGYHKKEVLNKTPRILQGAETSINSRKNIRKKLEGNLPFKEIITNHKKDGTPYKPEFD